MNAGMRLSIATVRPEPEILPGAAHTARDGLVMATAHSGFPDIFGGALDACANKIAQPVMIAAAAKEGD